VNIINQSLFNGTDWRWTETLEGKRPSDGWELKLTLKFKNNEALIIPGEASDSSFLFAVSAETTKTLPAGEYSYQFILKKDSSSSVCGWGSITIQSLLSSSQDSRNYWETVADNLRDLILQLSTKEVDILEWNNRKYTFKDIAKLRKELHIALINSGKTTRKPKRILERYL
jgi:hypothetical protein